MASAGRRVPVARARYGRRASRPCSWNGGCGLALSFQRNNDEHFWTRSRLSAGARVERRARMESQSETVVISRQVMSLKQHTHHIFKLIYTDEEEITEHTTCTGRDGSGLGRSGARRHSEQDVCTVGFRRRVVTLVFASIFVLSTNSCTVAARCFAPPCVPLARPFGRAAWPGACRSLRAALRFRFRFTLGLIKTTITFRKSRIDRREGIKRVQRDVGERRARGA